MTKQNIILFVNRVATETIKSLKEYGRKTNQRFRIGLIRDSRLNSLANIQKKQKIDILIVCDTTKPSSIEKALLPHQEELLAINCWKEKDIPYFAKIVPFVPYLLTPSTEALFWSSDKIAMRERLTSHDKNISPKFKVIKHASKKAVEQIREEVGLPVVVKPAGLASSLLVSVCFHKEELLKVLRKTFRKIRTTYKEQGRKTEPKVLAEEFMEGELYSIEAYVSNRGKIDFIPMIYSQTGRSLGFDDFFIYKRLTPANLKPDSISKAQEVSRKAIRALGLKNTTAHVEMIKTEHGWKIVEVGARVGGYRQEMYKMCFGIDNELNDVLIRIPKKPIIPKRQKGFAGYLKFYPKEEGVITKILGLKKIKALSSFKKIIVYAKLGETAKFAKHGGQGLCDVTLFNKDRSNLLADIRRVEQTLIIETE